MILFKKNKNPEITENHKILFNNKITPLEYKLFGIQLNDSVNKIDLSAVQTTTLEKLPDDAKGWSYRNGTTYYLVGKNEFEYKLADRIKTVIEKDGVLHMKSGIKYRIENKKIVEFRIDGELLKKYKIIPKENIEKFFGEADSIEEDYDYQHGELMQTIYTFKNNLMRIFYDEWDNEIDGINIGIPLNRE